MLNKWSCAAICLAMGGLQAWDSGIGRAEGIMQGLVVVAILLPVIALLLTERYGIRAAAVAAAFVLLTAVRAMSSVPLPTLHIVAFIPGVLIFFSKVVSAQDGRRSASA